MPIPRALATEVDLSGLQPGDYLLTRTAGGIGIRSSDGARIGFLARGAFINPSVSDDLQWLAFIGEDGRLSLDHLPGRTLVQTADATPEVFFTQWSPNATLLLAQLADGPTNTSIGILAVPSLELIQQVNLEDSQYSPAWSPDGLSMAFVSDHLRFPQGDIYTLEVSCRDAPAGCSRDLASPVSDHTDFSYYHISWSPDGTQLVSGCEIVAVSSPTTAICTIDLSTGDVRRITELTKAVSHPLWLPSGDQVSYWDDFQEAAFLIPATGGPPEILYSQAGELPMMWISLPASVP